MEGRSPPPKNKHPFPNNPDIRNFWNYRMIRGYIVTGLVIWGSFFGIYEFRFWLRRDIKTWLGMDLDVTSEQMLERKRMIQKAGIIKRNFETLQPGIKPEQFSPSMKFDETIEFAPTRSDVKDGFI